MTDHQAQQGIGICVQLSSPKVGLIFPMDYDYAMSYYSAHLVLLSYEALPLYVINVVG
jgi:hypothetical protein